MRTWIPSLLLVVQTLAAAEVSIVAGPEQIKLNEPFGVDFDRSGNWYIVEHKGQRIVRVDSRGEFSTFAGTGEVGKSGDNGPAKQATFFDPHGIAITRDSAWMYVADTRNHKVRRIDMRSGVITTVAGTGEEGFSGDGGPAVAATFRGTFGIALAPDDKVLFIADLGNRRIRRVDLKSGIVTTTAGNGEKGVPADGARAKDAPLMDPRAVTVDSKHNVYILERGGNALRVVSKNGVIHTVIAPGQIQPDMKGPKHLCTDRQDRVIIADAENHLIRRYDPKTKGTETIAGTAVKGSKVASADAKQTELNRPHGVAVNRGGDLYVIDSYNNRVLRLH